MCVGLNVNDIFVKVSDEKKSRARYLAAKVCVLNFILILSGMLSSAVCAMLFSYCWQFMDHVWVIWYVNIISIYLYYILSWCSENSTPNICPILYWTNTINTNRFEFFRFHKHRNISLSESLNRLCFTSFTHFLFDDKM